MDALQKKIREVEEEHAGEIVNSRLEQHEKEKYAKALLVLGGIRAADRIAQNLSSQVMSVLITFQDEKLHESLGYSRFADFLDQSEYSPMSKNDFYRRKDIYESEGAQLYDTFNEMKIPLATRRLLAEAKGTEIVIEGDKLIIGDQEIARTETETIKEVVKSLAAEIRDSKQSVEKKDAEIEKLKSQLDTGREEYEELRRAMDAMNEGDPHDRALSKLLSAFVQFNREVSNLPLVEKEKKYDAALNALWVQINITRRNYLRDDYRFDDPMDTRANAVKQNLDPKVRAIVEDDDDFGDEFEQ